MSRLIDAFEPHGEFRRIRLLIASPCRTGTVTMSTAMERLGYKPYHGKEAVLSPGGREMPIMHEAMTAAQNRLSGIKPYSRADYDKWFYSYDCLTEMPFVLGPSLYKAYLQDADIKVILVHRDTKKWIKSFNGTLGETWKLSQAFLMPLYRRLHRHLDGILKISETIYALASQNTAPHDADNAARLEETYTSYVESVRKMVPAHRLLDLRLEDGLEWKALCEFLGKDVPDEPFPHDNQTPEYLSIVRDGVVSTWHREAKMRAAGVLATAVGGVAALWYFWNPSCITKL